MAASIRERERRTTDVETRRDEATNKANAARHEVRRASLALADMQIYTALPEQFRSVKATVSRTVADTYADRA